MSGKQRLQELFAQYDDDGDGVLSEEEMAAVITQLGNATLAKRIPELFEANDTNKDGEIQVHEFLSWVCGRGASVQGVQQGDRYDVVVTNLSDRASKRFTFEPVSCQNVEMMDPDNFVLEPGEQVTKTLFVYKPGGKITFSYRYTTRSIYKPMPEDPNAFKDPEFLQDMSSIGSSSTSFHIEPPEMWLPARRLGDPTEAVLFDQVKPQDIRQGSLGDCWLMSVLSCLAAQPSRIKRLFNTKHLTDDGKYEISLFDLDKKAWEQVVIDEYIPCKLVKGEPKASYAQPVGEELWVLLMEKAIAKFCGSYGALAGGSASWALSVLTGEMDLVCYIKKPDGLWKLCRASKDNFKKGGRVPYCRSWLGYKNDKYPLDKVYEVLSQDTAENFAVTCSIKGQVPEAAEEANKNGLYTRHEYSLLKVLDEQLDDGTPMRFVILRNPWGMLEWRGDWGDRSDLWNQNPKLLERKQQRNTNAEDANDGRFYMSFDDWSRLFDIVVICGHDGGVKKRKEKRAASSAPKNEAAGNESQTVKPKLGSFALLASVLANEEDREDEEDDAIG